MEEISITPQILEAWTQTNSDDNQIKTTEQINIFLQIKDINHKLKATNMDEI